MSEIFEKLMENPYYKSIIEQIPEDERPHVIKALRELVERFENNLLVPLQNIKKE